MALVKVRFLRQGRCRDYSTKGTAIITIGGSSRTIDVYTPKY
jgi:hypothetical protein